MQNRNPKDDEKWVRRMQPTPVTADSLFDDLRRIYASNSFTAEGTNYASILQSPDMSVLKDNIQLLSQIDSVSTYAPSNHSFRSRSSSSSDLSILSEAHLAYPPSVSFHLVGSAILSGILSSIASYRDDPRPRMYLTGYGVCSSLFMAHSNLLLRASGGAVLADIASLGILGLTERSRLTDLENRGYITGQQKSRSLTASVFGSAGSFIGYRLGLMAVGDQVDVKRVMCCLGFSFVGSYVGRRMAYVMMEGIAGGQRARLV